MNCDELWSAESDETYLLIRELLRLLEHVLRKEKLIIQIIKQHQLSGKLSTKQMMDLMKNGESFKRLLFSQIVKLVMQAKSAEKVHHKEVAENLRLREAALQNSLPDVRCARVDDSQCATGAIVPITFIEMSKSRKNDNPLLTAVNVFSLAEDVWRHQVCVC